MASTEVKNKIYKHDYVGKHFLRPLLKSKTKVNKLDCGVTNNGEV